MEIFPDIQRPLNEDLLKCVLGKDTLSPLDYLQALAARVAKIDHHFSPHSDVSRLTDEFFSLLKNNQFLPAPSVITKGLDEHPVLFRHVGFELSDRLDEIFAILKRAMIFLQHGVQVAINFSRMRASRSVIYASDLQAVGPLRFLEFFEWIPQTTSQKTMLTFGFRVDHLEILEFLDFVEKAGPHLRFQLWLTQNFLEALSAKENFKLTHKPGAESSQKISAQRVWQKIQGLITNGAPLDLIFEGPMQALWSKNHFPEKLLLNPKCQSVEAGELMSLGTFNLTAFVDCEGFLEEKLKQALRVSLHFLENLFELNFYFDDESRAKTKENRRLGLSLLGLGEVLQFLNPEHSFKKSQNLLKRLSSLLRTTGMEFSQEMRSKRGGKQTMELNDETKLVRHAQLFAQINLPFCEELSGTPSYFSEMGLGTVEKYRDPRGDPEVVLFSPLGEKIPDRGRTTMGDIFQQTYLENFKGWLVFHKQWQQDFSNVVSFPFPQELFQGDVADFSKCFEQAYCAGCVAFEILSHPMKSRKTLGTITLPSAS